jgi:hypothetical protein
MKLGRKSLIPPQLQHKLQSVENGARWTLARHSFQTPFGRFVPVKALEELTAEMKRYEKQWKEQRAELCNHMRKHQREVRADYIRLARTVYADMKKKLQDNQAEAYARRIISAIPDVENIRRSFYFDFQLSRAPMPTVYDREIRESIVKEEKTAEELKTIRASAERQRQADAKIAELWERNKSDKVERFICGINEQIRRDVSIVAKAALDSINKKNRLMGKTSVGLKGMMERWKVMNILNDVELDREIKTVEKLLATPLAKRGEYALRDALQSLHEEATSTALDLQIPEDGREVREDLLADHHEQHVAAASMGVPDDHRIAAGDLDLDFTS